MGFNSGFKGLRTYFILQHKDIFHRVTRGNPNIFSHLFFLKNVTLLNYSLLIIL